MGKKKKQRDDDLLGRIDFDDPDSVFRMLDEIAGVGGGNNIGHESDNIDALSYSMAGMQQSVAPKPVGDMVARPKAKPMPRRTNPPTAVPKDVATQTVPKQKEQPPAPKYPGIRVASAHSDYGYNKMAIAITRCAACGQTAGSFVIPMYELGNAGPCPFSVTDDMVTDSDWNQVAYDLAVLSALRFEPDAIYPYNPEGITKLVSVLNRADLNDVVTLAIDGAIQCYVIKPDIVNEYFVEPLTRRINNAPFAVDRLRLIWDIMPSEGRPLGPVSVEYDPDRCATPNMVFEETVSAARKSNNITDLSTILVDPSRFIESLITDIVMTLSPSLEDALVAADISEPDGIETGEEDGGTFEPYDDEEDEEYDETSGGASNDNEPFPTGANASSREEQGANPSGENVTVASEPVRGASSSNVERREYHSESIGTPLGEILKSAGFGTSGEKATGDPGRDRSANKEEQKEPSKDLVQVLGRGDNVGEQQEKETKEKEEKGSMVISVTTVGR